MNPSRGLNTPFAMFETTVAVSLLIFNFWFSLKPAREDDSFEACLIWTSLPPWGGFVIPLPLQIAERPKPFLYLREVRARERLWDFFHFVHRDDLAEDV